MTEEEKERLYQLRLMIDASAKYFCVWVLEQF